MSDDQPKRRLGKRAVWAFLGGALALASVVVGLVADAKDIGLWPDEDPPQVTSPPPPSQSVAQPSPMPASAEATASAPGQIGPGTQKGNSGTGGTHTNPPPAPTTSPPATINVHNGGDIHMNPNSMADLDADTPQNNDTYDIQISDGGATLTVKNGAQIARMAAGTAIAYASCDGASWGTTIPASQLVMDMKVCLRTSSGRRGMLLVTKPQDTSSSDYRIWFNFTIWDVS